MCDAEVCDMHGAILADGDDPVLRQGQAQSAHRRLVDADLGQQLPAGDAPDVHLAVARARY